MVAGVSSADARIGAALVPGVFLFADETLLLVARVGSLMFVEAWVLAPTEMGLTRSAPTRG